MWGTELLWKKKADLFLGSFEFETVDRYLVIDYIC